LSVALIDTNFLAQTFLEKLMFIHMVNKILVSSEREGYSLFAKNAAVGSYFGEFGPVKIVTPYLRCIY
jgi:hypothetical protein